MPDIPMNTLEEVMTAIDDYDLRLLVHQGGSAESFLNSQRDTWQHVITHHVDYLDDTLTFSETRARIAQRSAIFMVQGFNEASTYARFDCNLRVVGLI